EEQRLQDIVKKYSDFIRYPIKMMVTKSKPKEDDTDEKEEDDNNETEYVDYVEEEKVNSMVPIWRKKKSELTDEDYENFYHEKHYGYDKNLTQLHNHINRNIRYNTIY